MASKFLTCQRTTLLLCSLIFALSDTLLHSMTAFIGETVHLQCGYHVTSFHMVDWVFQPSVGGRAHQIISGSYLTNGGFGGRLNIGGSTLIIEDVKTNDSGVYTCIEDTGLGAEHRVALTVHGKFIQYIFRVT